MTKYLNFKYFMYFFYHDLISVKATQPKGELDLLNLESLINVDDVNKRRRGGSMKHRSIRGNTVNSLSISVTTPPPTSSSGSSGQRF